MTFIFGNYETLHEPLDGHRNVEYVCVTDNPKLKSQNWKIIYDPINSDYTPFRKVVEVRYNPFKYVSNDICLIVDGSIQLKHIPWNLIHKIQTSKYDLCTLVHPARTTLQEEITAWKNIRHLPDFDVNLCRNWIANINYDSQYKGLFQIGIMIVRKSNLVTELFQKILVVNNACSIPESTFRVDQIVFSAIINKFYEHKLKVLPILSDELHGHFFGIYNHNSLHEVPEKIVHSCKKQYVFNKLRDVYSINTIQ